MTEFGRFTVVARVRPKMPGESPAPSPLEPSPASQTVSHALDAEPYRLDHVLTEKAQQKEVRAAWLVIRCTASLVSGMMQAPVKYAF
eukprot:scaffold22548_cov31-Prasinocladus_malaysianus.AAC.2